MDEGRRVFYREIIARDIGHEADRRTGRTTLMLKQVDEAVQEGFACVIVTSSESHSRVIADMFKKVSTNPTLRFWSNGQEFEDVKSRGSLWLVTIDKENHNALRGFRGLIFRDHYAVEAALSAANAKISELQREVFKLRKDGPE